MSAGARSGHATRGRPRAQRGGEELPDLGLVRADQEVQAFLERV
jgi:hypothetical protein